MLFCVFEFLIFEMLRSNEFQVSGAQQQNLGGILIHNNRIKPKSSLQKEKYDNTYWYHWTCRRLH